MNRKSDMYLLDVDLSQRRSIELVGLQPLVMPTARYRAMSCGSKTKDVEFEPAV